MLYVLYGTDTKKVHNKASMLVRGLLEKKPDAAYVRFDEETFTEDVIAEYTQAQGLFTDRAIVVLDGVWKAEEGKTIVLDRAQDLAESDNIFILIEENLDTKTLTKLKRYAKQVQMFEEKKKATPRVFNVFSLTDALGARNKKKLWVLYQKALRGGSVAEELHGILFWQIKTLLLVSIGETHELKPFVVGKAKRFLRNYTQDELERISAGLVELYHDARRGKFELSIGLEKFLLSL